MTAPFDDGGAMVGRGNFYAGDYMGQSLNPFSLARTGGWSYRNLYVHFRMKFSGGWQSHSSGVNKNFYITEAASARFYVIGRG